MIKGIYISRMGMNPRMVKMDIIANNLANINTTAFKKDNVFIRRLSELTPAQVDGTDKLSGLQMDQFISYLEGAFNQTGNPLDVAIQGEGFFVVETQNGPQYTRNGNFTISADGILVTGKGDPVLGEGGHIRFNNHDRLETATIRIDETGSISLEEELVGRLRIVTFESLQDLKKNGELFSAQNAIEEELDPAAGYFLIRQGFLEESNVDAIQEMIRMIELSRNFETYQRMIQMQDSTIEQSINVGRL